MRVVDWYFSLDDDRRFWRHLAATVLLISGAGVWVAHRYGAIAGII
jgi:hypothetical protein